MQVPGPRVWIFVVGQQGNIQGYAEDGNNGLVTTAEVGMKGRDRSHNLTMAASRGYSVSLRASGNTCRHF